MKFSIFNTYEIHASAKYAGAVAFATKMAKAHPEEPVVIRELNNEILQSFIWDEDQKDIIPFYGSVCAK